MILWGVKCVQIYLSEFESAEVSKLDNYIQKILELGKYSTSSQCIKIGREVWDMPERSNPQIAVARLWWALSACKLQHDSACIMEINAAITLLLPKHV